MKKQVCVIWSAFTLWYNQQVSDLAYQLGLALAQEDVILVIWAEQNQDSLPSIVARWYKDGWWTISVGITYNQSMKIWLDRKYIDVVIPCGLNRWWWREFVLASSCDVVIMIAGGAWTLNEMSVAYQKSTPIIAFQDTWWRSARIANTYIDERKKVMCYGVSTIEECLTILYSLV